MANKPTNKQQTEVDTGKTATVALTPRQALQSALRDGPDPLCVDLVDWSADGALRSSNGMFMRRLPREDIQAIIQLVKELAHLDPTRRVQTGTFGLNDKGLTVNCCPQYDGEILVIRRYF